MMAMDSFLSQEVRSARVEGRVSMATQYLMGDAPFFTGRLEVEREIRLALISALR